jgi:hypothetical protein
VLLKMSEFRFKDRFKSKNTKFSQENKRNEYLRKQKEKRRDLSMQLRVLSHDVLQSSSKANRTKKNARKAAARPHMLTNQLSEPEWMTEIPNDMVALIDASQEVRCEWFVLARPEGRRCVVISSRGTTISYLENGRVLHQFKSFLPGGGLNAQNGSSSIVECIYYEPTKIYYILDVMSWNDMHCYECNAEFRFYWLRAKVEETPFISPQFSAQQQFSFLPVPYWECSWHGLREAYASELPYVRNGLLFYHREGHYEIGLTPLILLWKDGTVTSYLDADGEETIALRIVNEVRDEVMEEAVEDQRHSTVPASAGATELSSNAVLCTQEGVPLLALADMSHPDTATTSEEEMARFANIRIGSVVRGAISEAGHEEETGAPFIVNFQPHKVNVQPSLLSSDALLSYKESSVVLVIWFTNYYVLYVDCWTSRCVLIRK